MFVVPIGDKQLHWPYQPVSWFGVDRMSNRLERLLGKTQQSLAQNAKLMGISIPSNEEAFFLLTEVINLREKAESPASLKSALHADFNETMLMYGKKSQEHRKAMFLLWASYEVQKAVNNAFPQSIFS